MRESEIFTKRATTQFRSGLEGGETGTHPYLSPIGTSRSLAFRPGQESEAAKEKR